MVHEISISNFKSIRQQQFPLSRINVFIGENGCGKSNVLEAIGMASAAHDNDLETESLWWKGIRVAKPALTFNSFHGQSPKKEIIIKWKEEQVWKEALLTCDNPNDIYARWTDKSWKGDEKSLIDTSVMGTYHFLDYLIYNISTNSLRGFTVESRKEPLGIFGEGLDVLLSTFNERQMDELKSYNFIPWLDNIIISENMKAEGLKLGRSTSKLYFTDKYMHKKNNLFSAENANEGALHVLFYLSLFISERTPSFFAIDNIDTALNPQLCRQLIKSITELAVKHDKQVLITTHNPAILDGLNLFDANQKLLIVKRADDGQTIIEELKAKPQTNDGKYKLSELWMRGFIGGLPNTF